MLRRYAVRRPRARPNEVYTKNGIRRPLRLHRQHATAGVFSPQSTTRRLTIALCASGCYPAVGAGARARARASKMRWARRSALVRRDVILTVAWAGLGWAPVEKCDAHAHAHASRARVEERDQPWARCELVVSHPHPHPRLLTRGDGRSLRRRPEFSAGSEYERVCVACICTSPLAARPNQTIVMRRGAAG